MITMLHGKGTRTLRTAVFYFGLALLLSGCHHKTMPPRLPAVLLTPDVPPPVPSSPPMESPPPASVSTAPAVKVTQVKPKRSTKKTAAKATAPEVPPPVEIATATAVPSEASPIGELTTGGVANPQMQQQAADLIASSERRVDDLSKSATAQQQTQLRKISNFIRQAKQALATGDVDGANTLATKAKLLMDDLIK